jgi:hypothetical protein
MNVASADAGDAVPTAINAENARTLSKADAGLRFMAGLFPTAIDFGGTG